MGVLSAANRQPLLLFHFLRELGACARVTMQGISESMAPPIIGFAMLSMVALMTAVGKRRLDARRAA